MAVGADRLLGPVVVVSTVTPYEVGRTSGRTLTDLPLSVYPATFLMKPPQTGHEDGACYLTDVN